MRRLNEWISAIGKKNNYSFFAACFRIFICLFLIKNILLTWHYKELLYKASSFLPPSSSNIFELLSIDGTIIRDHFELFASVYLIVIVLYLMGFGKHFTAVLVYLFYELMQNLCPTILNGGDNILKFLILYMVFIDSYNYFALTKYKPTNLLTRHLSVFVSNVAGFSICLHICFVYFISAWHKIHADVWYNGVATYYILSLERFKGTTWNDSIVKNGVIVTLSTYFTMLVEIYYPVLVWFSKTKKIVVVSAIILHSGILIFMMLYGFQLIFIIVQGFFFSNSQWIHFANICKRNIRINRGVILSFRFSKKTLLNRLHF